MDIIRYIADIITNLAMNQVVLVPTIILIVALVFRVKFSTALKGSLMFAAGLAGTICISKLMTDSMTQVGLGLVENTGLTNEYVDVGMPVAFVGASMLPYFPLVYFVGVGLNMLMIKFKWTRTLNTDFLGYATMMLITVPVYFLTGQTIFSIIICLLIYAVYFIICLKFADLTVNELEQYYDVPGISCPHHHYAVQAMYVKGLNWIIDRIPVINKINFTMGDVKTKLGLFGEPTVIGFLIGTILGLLAKLPVAESVSCGVYLVTTMLLFPKAVGLMLEGLNPISKGIKDFLAKKYGHEMGSLYMGVDAAVFAGFPDVVAVTAVYIPIVILLHFILPGVKVLPTGESLQLAIVVGMILPFVGAKGHKGNVFRALLIGTILAIVGLYGQTYLAPVATQLAETSGMIEHGVTVSSFAFRYPQDVVVYFLTRLFTGH